MTPRRAAALGLATEGGEQDDRAGRLIGSHDTKQVNRVDRATSMSLEIVVDDNAVVDEVMTYDEARAVTDRLRQTVAVVAVQITKAYRGRAWLVLGYSSWEDYLEGEQIRPAGRLPRAERREVVAELRDAGLSTRAIAAATGASVGTIHADITCSELNTSIFRPGDAEIAQGLLGCVDSGEATGDEIIDQLDRAGVDWRSWTRLADVTDDEFEDVLAECRTEGDMSCENVYSKVTSIAGSRPPIDKITGLDGKKYTSAQKPATERRRPFASTWSYYKLQVEARRLANKLEQVVADDRFPRYPPDGDLRRELDRLVAACQAMVQP